MKKMRFLVLVSAFIFSALAAVPVAAEHAGHEAGKQCSQDHKCEGRDCEKCQENKGSSGCPINGKILKKAKFYLKNAKEIGLSDEQTAQIKAIKADAKKSDIRAEAEMQIGMMDLEAKLSEPTVDVEGLNAMVDQMTVGMSAGAKASVANYAKLKSILTDAQAAKAKEIWMRDDK